MNITLSKFRPAKDKIFVTELETGMLQTKGGIILTDDNMKNSGIRARWGQIIMVGEDIDYVQPGEWVLVEHGRWSYGMPVLDDDGNEITIWHIENKAMMVATDEDPRLSKVTF